MEITRNALDNMLETYVDHKKMMNEYEEEYDLEKLEDNADYMFHKGCCETAESWMRSFGVLPNCHFIVKRLSE